MGFFDNILAGLGFLDGPVSPIFRAVLVGDNALYIENVISIKNYSVDKIEAVLKKGEFTIRGENLYIKKYCAGDLVVCGKIKSMERD